MRGAGLVVAVGVAAGCGFDGPSPNGDGVGDGTEPVDGPRVDAPGTVDAAPDAPLACPGGYGGDDESGYRFVLTGATAWDAASDCADDEPGITHLIDIDDGVELGAVQLAVNLLPSQNAWFWIGGVQPQNQATPGTGWLSITGGDLYLDWATNEPTDDMPIGMEGNREQFIRINRGGNGMIDAPGKLTEHRYICECDGKAQSAAATDAISAAKNNSQ